MIWGRGFAFPGPPPAEPLKRWIAMNSLEGGHYHMAYPAGQREDDDGVARGPRPLRGARQARPTACRRSEFRKAFDAAVGDLQRHL